MRFSLKYCCVRTWEVRCRGVGVGFAAVDVCCIQSRSDHLVCLGSMSVVLGKGCVWGVVDV